MFCPRLFTLSASWSHVLPAPAAFRQIAYEAYATDVQKAKFGTFVQLTPEEAKCPTSQLRCVTR